MGHPVLDRSAVLDRTPGESPDLPLEETLRRALRISIPFHSPGEDWSIPSAPVNGHTSTMQSRADRLWDVLREAEAADDDAPFHRLLRRAMHLAVLAGSRIDPIALDGDELLDELRWFAQGLSLEAHYLAYPHVRPTLAGITEAYARQRHSPVAERPELLEEAVRLARESFGDTATARDVYSVATTLLTSR